MLREEKLQECREMVPYKYELSYTYRWSISVTFLWGGGEPEGCVTSQKGDGSFTNYRHLPAFS